MTSNLEADSTVRLILRWHAGDQTALDQLVRETEPWLRASIRSSLDIRLRRVEDSADFAHTAMVKFLEYGPRFVPKSTAEFRGFVRRVALNEIIDRQRRLRTSGAGDSSQYRDAVIDLRGSHTDADPPRIAGRDEERAWMRMAMELLNDRERQLLYAREVDGRAWGDIALELGYETENGARMACQRLLPHVAKLVRRLRSGELSRLLEKRGRD